MIWPKLLLVGAVTGAENCTRSNALNVSARSCSVALRDGRVLDQRHVQRIDGVEPELAEIRRQRPDVAIELLCGLVLNAAMLNARSTLRGSHSRSPPR